MGELERKVRLPLFLMRITVFLVMLMWTIDKFVNPGHASKVFEMFYKIGGLSSGVMTVIGVVELLIILGFLLGIAKKFTYGIVLILHAISTFASFPKYLAPYEAPNLLFFAAWPMLAACIALYVLRDYDTLAAVGGSQRVAAGERQAPPEGAGGGQGMGSG